MIKPDDIHLGNHIYHLGVDYDRDAKVLDAAKDEFITATPDNIAKIKACPDDYGGIPMSADLLERAGFMKDAAQEFEPEAIDYYLELHLDGLQHKFLHALVHQNASVTINCVTDEEWDQCSVTTLHELQNSYYDLTGEPLPINLNTLSNV